MKKYSNYWETRLKIKYKKEIKKYKDLCSGKIGRKNSSVCAYGKWEKDTEKILKVLTLEELEEHRHWLILRIEELEMDNNLKMSFLFPLLVAMVVGMFSGAMFQNMRMYENIINCSVAALLIILYICFAYWWVGFISKRESYKRRYFKDSLSVVEDMIGENKK